MAPPEVACLSFHSVCRVLDSMRADEPFTLLASTSRLSSRLGFSSVGTLGSHSQLENKEHLA